MLAHAREPLGYPIDARRIIDRTSKLPDTRRDSAYPPWRLRHVHRVGDELRVILKDSSTEQAPVTLWHSTVPGMRHTQAKRLSLGLSAFNDLPTERSRTLRETQFVRLVFGREQPDERNGVTAGRTKNRNDVTRMSALNVIARSALVPDQPVMLNGEVPSTAAQDCRIRTEQQITSRGDVRKLPLDRIKFAAAVVLDYEVKGTSQLTERFKPCSSL